MARRICNRFRGCACCGRPGARMPVRKIVIEAYPQNSVCLRWYQLEVKLVGAAIVVPSEEANAPDQRIESVINSYRDMSNQRFSLTKLWKRLLSAKRGSGRSQWWWYIAGGKQESAGKETLIRIWRQNTDTRSILRCPVQAQSRLCRDQCSPPARESGAGLRPSDAKLFAEIMCHFYGEFFSSENPLIYRILSMTGGCE